MCHCGKDEACHADVLVDLTEAMGVNATGLSCFKNFFRLKAKDRKRKVGEPMSWTEGRKAKSGRNAIWGWIPAAPRTCAADPWARDGARDGDLEDVVHGAPFRQIGSPQRRRAEVHREVSRRICGGPARIGTQILGTKGQGA